MGNMISKLNKKIEGSPFVKNILLITGGAAFSQVLNMVFSPLITRLYSPEEYGILSVYIAVLGALSFVGTFNYEMGIPIADDDEKAINVLILSLIILSSSVLLLVVVINLFGSRMLILLNANTLNNFLFLVPLGLFLRGAYSIFVQWAYRKKNFTTITKTRISQAAARNGTKVVLGLLGRGPIGLLVGQIFGECSGLVTLSYKQIIKDKHLITNITKKEIFSLARRYKDFPLYTTTRRYLGDITISLPIVFLTSLYGSQVVGFYGLANTVIQLPMNLIGTSISNVYYAECASLKDQDPKRIRHLSNKMLKSLIILGLFPVVILALWGPELFGFVFGDSWVEAGIYARLLSISVFSRFIFKPISNLFDIFEKQRFAFWINVIRVILVVSVFTISNWLAINSYWAVCLYSVAMAIVYFIQYIGAQRVINEAIVKKYKVDTII